VLIESSHEDEIDAYEAFYGDEPEGDWIDGGDLIDIQKTEAELRRARDFGDLPLVAIRAERYEDVLAEELWRRTQADLATLSTNGVAVIARGSGHFVMNDNPGVVVAAVEAVVRAARSDQPLLKCPALFADVAAECPGS
jgi:pimeloyl-ACP methyl ester carboxylesterase